jgi:predicted acylesterase/phospholipase RssA
MTAPDRYCDIVMKGGVTSGIIYPFAISKLSTAYSFKSIGGTSAGAIAAAAAAAAEYRRRYTGSNEGFTELDLLPNTLSVVDDDKKRSKLFRLFQPQPGTHPLFAMLVASLNRQSFLSRLVHLVSSGLIQFWLYSLVGALFLGAIAWASYMPALPMVACQGWLCWIAWIPILLLSGLGALAGLTLAVYRCLSSDVVANGFGLCKGHSDRQKYVAVNGQLEADEELTDWLHNLINRSAGRTPNDPPVTFGDLWSAPGFPPTWLKPYMKDAVRSIDLQMMTTNVTHGRPYKLPFQDADSRLFFRPEELREYFPKIVTEWMDIHRAEYKPTESDPESLPLGLLAMPAAEDLPVVVAARLSLSYPVLISAVPLWAIDYEAPREQRTFERCWFSDGGISSNFPVHFFDSLLPLWPTFGVKLEGFPKGYSQDPNDRIYMPFRNVEGRADGWSRFDERKGFERFKGFVSAVIDSMMNWNDNTLSKIPGYRDRIVRVRLREDEGGMNLNIGDEKIEILSNLGDFAAEEILERFVHERPVGPDDEVMGWENHRWVRLRSLVAILEQAIPELREVVETEVPGAPRYKEQVSAAMTRSPDQQPFGDVAQVALVLDAIEGLSAVANLLQRTPETRSTAPQPLPALRVRPNL